MRSESSAAPSCLRFAVAIFAMGCVGVAGGAKVLSSARLC
jgi:hypothetical protein